MQLSESLFAGSKGLKIKAAYISAIENCDLDAFPNKGFIAGYVRSYARYLTLSPEEVYERFVLNLVLRMIIRVLQEQIIIKIKVEGLQIASQLNWQPSNIGVNETENSIWSRRYLFMPYSTSIAIFIWDSFWRVESASRYSETKNRSR